MTGPWAERLLRQRLVQPDARSCGPACLVVARGLVDEGYAELLTQGRHPTTGHGLVGAVADRFAQETLAMHRRVTGLVDVRGRLQLPWPRALGTPPWAVARQLSAGGTPYVVRPARWGREGAFARLRAAVSAGTPAAVYAGDRWLPRHVVLAVRPEGETGLWCYDPGLGGERMLTRAGFVAGALELGRWATPWFVVVPR